MLELLQKWSFIYKKRNLIYVKKTTFTKSKRLICNMVMRTDVIVYKKTSWIKLINCSFCCQVFHYALEMFGEGAKTSEENST